MNIYSAKCYFSYEHLKNGDGEIGYEQRIVILRAPNEDEALELAEKEAVDYAHNNNAKYLNFIEIYKLQNPRIEFAGILEIYSLTMFDEPSVDNFLDNYYLTGGNVTVKE